MGRCNEALTIYVRPVTAGMRKVTLKWIGKMHIYVSLPVHYVNGASENQAQI